MNIQQITNQLRKQSKTFGRNITLERAEKKKEFTEFRAFLYRTFIKQYTHITKNSKLIEDLLSFYKETNQNAKLYLNTEWLALKTIAQDEFEQYYAWSGTIGGQSALDKMGIRAKPFFLSNTEVLQYFKNRTNLIINNVNEVQKELLLSVFKEAQALYLTPYEISQLILERLDNITKNRADLIARNELAHAVNTVEYETFLRNQVTKVRWVTAMDDRVCPFCEPLHNTEQTISNKFNSSVDTGTKVTNYSVNRPPLHVNCRCYLEEVMDFTTVRNNRIVWSGN